MILKINLLLKYLQKLILLTCPGNFNCKEVKREAYFIDWKVSLQLQFHF